MLSNRPYLLRAFFQWIVDSSCTPILVIDALHPRCKIPQDYVDGGEIVFNVSSTAVRDLKMANDAVEFNASFSGVIHRIHAPIRAILALYAEENGEGIFFDAEDDAGTGESIIQIKSVENSHAQDSDSIEQDISAISIASIASKPILKLVE